MDETNKKGYGWTTGHLSLLYLLLWYQLYQSHITYLIRSPCQWKKHTETFYQPVNCLLEVAAWWWLVASIFPMRWHWPVVRHWWDQVVAQLGVVISIIRFQIWLPSIVWNYTSWLITLTELIASIPWFTVVISPDNKWSWVYKPWILSVLKGAPRYLLDWYAAMQPCSHFPWLKGQCFVMFWIVICLRFPWFHDLISWSLTQRQRKRVFWPSFFRGVYLSWHFVNIHIIQELWGPFKICVQVSSLRVIIQNVWTRSCNMIGDSLISRMIIRCTTNSDLTPYVYSVFIYTYI